MHAILRVASTLCPPVSRSTCISPHANLCGPLLVALSIGLTAMASPCLAQFGNGPDSRAPGDAPSWARSVKQSYEIDSKPGEGKKDPVVKEEPRPSTVVNTVHITLTGPTGEAVPGGFMRPKTDGVYPVILLLHGLTSDKDAVLKLYGVPLVMHGFAVLALDAPYHGERKNPDIRQTDTDVFGNTIHEGVREYRVALDWLAKRKDIDPHRIGLIGYSLGAMMGVILGAVDDRVQDLVLCVGGDPVVSFAPNIPEGKRDNMYGVSPSLFIGHIAPRRVLMLNGKKDMVMLYTASQRLFDAARQPKTQEWYDSGHILPAIHTNRCIGWLVEQLNPTPQSL